MSSTPDPGRDRGDLPSGEPTGPDDHRTLAQRLTGRGRTRDPGDGTGTGDTGTNRTGFGGTDAPPRNVATTGEDRYGPQDATPAGGDTTAMPQHADSSGADERRRVDAAEERGGADGRVRTDEGDSHTGAVAGGSAVAGAAGGAAAAYGATHDDRTDDDRTHDDRTDDDRTDGRYDDDRYDRDNRYARRDEDRDDPDDAGVATDRRAVLDRERDKFGGARVGTGFFGWMAATGLAVLMTALTEAIGTAVGANPVTSIPSVTGTTSKTATTIGWGGTIVLLIIMFLAYLGGGYVAGRMARFHGVRQGLLVWLWGLVVAVVIAAVAHFAGSQYDILGLLNDFPRIPIEGGVTTWGVIALIVVAIAGLVGALLGGLWGMSYHRRVDRAGLGR
ncbi:MAG TPA: hypothetical protein VFJ12_00180 [Segeticoccus sp.]|nr:hypothetical protein [Segeticoccus sp.]